MKIITIGAYGFTEESFFKSLTEAGVDTFCDIRQRRGVRGAEYAFVNSQRLQNRLSELGIRYLYRRDLAPTKAIRQRQQEADKAGKVAKRQRAVLGQAFINDYQMEILDAFDSQSLVGDLEVETQVVALFCVERDPAACHRSLVTEKLHLELGWEVEHLLP